MDLVQSVGPAAATAEALCGFGVAALTVGRGVGGAKPLGRGPGEKRRGEDLRGESG